MFWIVLLSTLIIGTAPIKSSFKLILFTFFIGTQVIFTFIWLNNTERKNWWGETLRFFKDIIPLLFLGVFLSGAITNLIPQDEFQRILGRNNLLTNLLAVMFGILLRLSQIINRQINRIIQFLRIMPQTRLLILTYPGIVLILMVIS